MLLELFLTFIKIGAVSFGGGYSMISLLKEEVITHGWLTEGEFLNFIAVAESTPGPIAINMATFIGSSQSGFIGAFLATLGVILPAFIIILVIASIVSGLLKFGGVQGFLRGVRPVVIGLIVSTGLITLMSVVLGIKTINQQISFDYKSLIIFSAITIIHIIYKKIKKKGISPIILIIISALLGILFYGTI